MSTFALPALYALLVWWASTGLVLYAVGLAGRAPRTAVGLAALVFGGALAALAATAGEASVGGAYGAFTAAIVVWGVQELAFLAGWITGPWREPLPAGAVRWARTRYAIAAILYHELALAASGLAILAVTWGAPNQVGAWTFLILFAMRISAKLNVFLGVPNLTEGFLPAHLDYLKSFFARRPMNLLFPVSVTASTVLLIAIVGRTGEAAPAEAAGLALAATLVGLALLEHWLLVLPLPVEALWSWGLGSRPQQPVAVAPIDLPDVEAAKVVRLVTHPVSRAAAQSLAAGRPGYLRAVPDARVVATGSESGGRVRP